MSQLVTLATTNLNKNEEAVHVMAQNRTAVSVFRIRASRHTPHAKARYVTPIKAAFNQENPVMLQRHGDLGHRMTIHIHLPPLTAVGPNAHRVTPLYCDDVGLAIIRNIKLKAGNEVICESTGQTMLLNSQNAAHVSQRIDEDIGSYFDDVSACLMAESPQDILVNVDMTPFKHGQLPNALPLHRMKGSIPALVISTRDFADVTELNVTSKADLESHRVVQAGRGIHDAPVLDMRLIGEYYTISEEERNEMSRQNDRYLYHVNEILEEGNVQLSYQETVKTVNLQPSGLIRSMYAFVQPRHASDRRLYRMGRDFFNYGTSFNRSGEPIVKAVTKVDQHEIEDVDCLTGTRIFHNHQGTLRSNRTGYFALLNQASNVNFLNGGDGAFGAGTVDAIRTTQTMAGPQRGGCPVDVTLSYVTDRYQSVVAHNQSLFVYSAGQSM